MTSIAYPVHKAESGACQQAITKMIFDQDHPANANRFPQKEQWIGCVMKDVHKHDSVKTRIGMRNSFTVERPNRNMGAGADEWVNTLNGHIRPLFHNEAVDHSISTTDVEDACTSRDESS